MKRTLVVPVIVAVLLAAATLPAGADLQPDARAAQDAAKAIATAQAKANAVAAQVSDSQTHLAELEQQITDLEAQAAQASARRDAVRDQVRAVALERYMSVGESHITLMLPAATPDEAMEKSAISKMVTGNRLAAVEQYRTLTIDLHADQDELARRRAEQRDTTAQLARQQGQLEAVFAQLQDAEQVRLTNETLTIAADKQRIAAQAAAKQAAADAARKQAQAEANKRKAAEDAARKKAAAERTTTTTAPAKSTNGTKTTSPTATTAPPKPNPSDYVVPGPFVCPVNGPHAFTNDWGAPRSGGRLHQGNDIMAARNTPAVAPVAGTVKFLSGGNGGNMFFVEGDDGNEYMGAHLDAFVGAEGRRVAPGETVGLVGDTGDAKGGATHLHFEIHPGHGAPVNPYPTLILHC
jgi:septal ring factor EnvC (AmiA/AmiB activator)